MKCPVCGLSLLEAARHHATGADAEDYRCPNCGNFTLTRTARAVLPGAIGDDPTHRAVLSHAIRRMQSTAESWPTIGSDTVARILQSARLPSASEIVERLILLLGESSQEPGHEVNLYPAVHLVARLGAVSKEGMLFALDSAAANGLIEKRMASGVIDAKLTLRGWSEFDALLHGRTESRVAFMAMQFADERLDRVYFSCFQLRRYRRRWKVERLFAWLLNFRRLVIRCERHAELFQSFVRFGCMVILLRYL